jgi:hypothetical protein
MLYKNATPRSTITTGVLAWLESETRMTERKTDLDEAIERFIWRWATGGLYEKMLEDAHNILDPLITLPEDVKLPVEVIYLPVTAAHQHLLAPCLGFDLQIAADIINRIAKEKG